MKNKQIPVHLIFSIIYFVLALVVSLPTGTAGKDSLLGYNALCSFTPISTLILLALGGMHLYFYYKKALVKSTE